MGSLLTNTRIRINLDVLEAYLDTEGRSGGKVRAVSITTYLLIIKGIRNGKRNRDTLAL